MLYNIVIVEKKLGHDDAARWVVRVSDALKKNRWNKFLYRDMLKTAQKIDATRYSIKTDFISLEKQIFVQKVIL